MGSYYHQSKGPVNIEVERRTSSSVFQRTSSWTVTYRTSHDDGHPYLYTLDSGYTTGLFQFIATRKAKKIALQLLVNEDIHREGMLLDEQIEKKRLSKYSLDRTEARSHYTVLRIDPARYVSAQQKWFAYATVDRPIGGRVPIDNGYCGASGATAAEAEFNTYEAAGRMIDEDLDAWLDIVKAHVDSGRPIPE